MSRRYEFSMQRHGKGRGKKRKNKLQDFEGFQGVSLFQVPAEPEPDTNRRQDVPSPEDIVAERSVFEESLDYDGDPAEISLTAHAVEIGQQKNENQFGQEFSGITDRISKLLNDYESMYDDKDDQGYTAMQKHMSGQMAMDSMLSDYKTLCLDREELLNSLQDSLDVDEDGFLSELENQRPSIDMDATQRAVQETFQSVKDTSERLKIMNRQMMEMSQQGQATEDLEMEKRQLERELQMYKKMAVQQRKDIFHTRRASIRKDETQQWKLVAGEMVDILKMVRNEGNLDKESLEKELNRIMMALNTQTEYIDNLKRDLSKSEKSAKNLEKEKTKINNEKLLVEDQLSTKQHELKSCKQYLRKVMGERKDPSEKIRFEGEEIDLKEGPDEGKMFGFNDTRTTTEILQAQVRDAKKLMYKTEEENRELKKKLLLMTDGKDKPVDHETQSVTELEREEDEEPPAAAAAAAAEVTEAVETASAASAVDCPHCAKYKAQYINKSEELKEMAAYVDRLKDQLNQLRAHLSQSQKETTLAKSKIALAEAEAKEEQQWQSESSGRSSAVEAQPSPDPEHDTESGEEEVVDKPKFKKTSKLTVPTKKPKPKLKPVRSPKKAKKVSKERRVRKEEIEAKEWKEEDFVDEPEVKTEVAVKRRTKQSTSSRTLNYKPRDLVVGECREEKAPYVTVREARMVTLSDKGTQTTHYGRKTSEGILQRDSIGPFRQPPQRRRRSIAEAIMSCVPPGAVEQETSSAMMFIKEEADRLCDEISGFVEYGFDLVQQGAQTNRMQAEQCLGEETAKELLERSSTDHASTEKAKSVKTDYRRQSITAHGRRRGSIIPLERRGTIMQRRDSRLPPLETIDTTTGRTREDSISKETPLMHISEHAGEGSAVQSTTNVIEEREGARDTTDARKISTTEQREGVRDKTDGVKLIMTKRRGSDGRHTPNTGSVTGQTESTRDISNAGSTSVTGHREDTRDTASVTKQREGTRDTIDAGNASVSRQTESARDSSSVTGQREGARDTKDAENASVTGQKEAARDTRDGGKASATRQTESARDTTVTAKQQPPAVRVNTLFPEQQVADTDHSQMEVKDDSRPSAHGTGMDDRRSEVSRQETLGASDRSSDGRTIRGVRSPKVPRQEKEASTLLDVSLPDRQPSPLEIALHQGGHIFDKSFLKKNKWKTLKHFIHSLQPHRGGGCSHVLEEVKMIAEGSSMLKSEDQVKEQVTVMAQHVIDTLQSTAQILNYQIEEELSIYEKFYKLWGDVREAQRPAIGDLDKKDEVPLHGKQLFAIDRASDLIDAEDSSLLFPLLTSQSSNYQTKHGKPIATAGLAKGGMMMIQGAGPTTGDAASHSTSQAKTRKRGKVQSWSRKQQMMKQKAYMDKILHVDAKLGDLRSIFGEMPDDTQSVPPTRQGQRVPLANSQDFFFPLMAQSMALPTLPQGKSQNQLAPAQTKEAKEEMAEDDDDKEPLQLPGMNVTWQRRQSIIPSNPKPVPKSQEEKSTKLPLLTINHLLKVGQ